MSFRGFHLRCDDAILKRLRHRPVLYVGEIGRARDYDIVHPVSSRPCDPDVALYKYGVSTDVYRRTHREHRKRFDRFDVRYAWETHRHFEVEGIVTKELRARRLLLQLRRKERMAREIMFFRDDRDELWFETLVNELILSRPPHVFEAEAD